MDKKQALQAVHYLQEHSPKRGFKQNYDLLITLKQLNIKKDTDKVLIFTALPHPKGKKAKIGAFVGQELVTSAKANCDKVITLEEFKTYDKKTIKKLARDIDYFIAQATLMPQVAAAFGKVLGPLGKMPNPKAGCVVPPTADLKQIVQKLQNTIRLETKTDTVIRTVIGTQESKDEDLAENIIHTYNTVMHALPQEKNNIKRVYLKLTMSPAVDVENVPTTTPEEKTHGT